MGMDGVWWCCCQSEAACDALRLPDWSQRWMTMEAVRRLKSLEQTFTCLSCMHLHVNENNACIEVLHVHVFIRSNLMIILMYDRCLHRDVVHVTFSDVQGDIINTRDRCILLFLAFVIVISLHPLGRPGISVEYFAAS